MHLEDLFSTANIGQSYSDLPIETARTKERGVQYVRSVGRSNDDDAIVATEAIHLNQQLVQCLLTLIVTAAKSRAPMTTDRIDLIDKNNAWGLLFA